MRFLQHLKYDFLLETLFVFTTFQYHDLRVQLLFVTHLHRKRSDRHICHPGDLCKPRRRLYPGGRRNAVNFLLQYVKGKGNKLCVSARRWLRAARALTFVGARWAVAQESSARGSRLSHVVGLLFKTALGRDKLNPRSFGDAPIMTFVFCLHLPGQKGRRWRRRPRCGFCVGAAAPEGAQQLSV